MEQVMTKVRAEKILGLTGEYSYWDFNNSYRESVKTNHPDLGGNPEKMVEVNKAKEYINRLFVDNKDALILAGAVTNSKATKTPVENKTTPAPKPKTRSDYEDKIEQDKKHKEEYLKRREYAAKAREKVKTDVKSDNQATKTPVADNSSNPRWFELFIKIVDHIPWRLIFIVVTTILVCTVMLDKVDHSGIEYLTKSIAFVTAFINCFTGWITGLLIKLLHLIAKIILKSVCSLKKIKKFIKHLL